jgi:signal transduction histidine kinase
MTGLMWLDWATLAVSLFNALLLLWLGLTVFLNAEGREWGIWLSSIGLLLGAVFFISHSAILVRGINEISSGLNFWWQIGWISVVALPFMWYLAVLWYSGYWDNQNNSAPSPSKLNQRQRKWFVLVSLFGLILIGLLVFTDLVPSLYDLVNGRLVIGPAIAGILALILWYMFCIGLSIDALNHPEKSKRLMGELARSRARRWLMATSVLLLGVCLLVGGVMIWIVWAGIFQTQLLITFGWFDLGIAVLIGISILLLGQAVVSYEVFTGKTLPRRGLAQYWRWAAALAAGFSLLISGSLVLGLHPIYTLLLSAVVMITFYALLGWRSYAERERLIKSLRPFASSQKMVDSLLINDPTSDRLFQEGELEAPFHALCENLLESERAGLFPYGQLSLLTGKPFFSPPGSEFYAKDLAGIAVRLQDGHAEGLSLEPGEANGAIFAVPLWRDGGLSGMILLGQKQGGRPYTQEEIEIAQATGERLIDARLTTEILRRLIALQRQHLVANQVIDQRARRKIHDEILPQVHTAILDLAAGDDGQSENRKTLGLLDGIHKQLANLLQSMPSATSADIEHAGLIGALRHTVEIEMNGAFNEVDWQIDQQAEALVKELPPFVSEVIYSAAREGLRNAARHGRGANDQNRLSLWIDIAVLDEGWLSITLKDNGVGFDNKISPGEYIQEFAFERGNAGEPASQQFNAVNSAASMQSENHAKLPSSGQGLALYSTLMAVIGGSLSVNSSPGQYTRIKLELPCSVWLN